MLNLTRKQNFILKIKICNFELLNQAFTVSNKFNLIDEQLF